MTFPARNFLLSSPTAETLYFEYAASMPILDYHNHLPPADIASNRTFETMTDIWLAGDHYKWRAMRTAGVDERYITGDATAREKFDAWARTVPRTIRNPLYHWTHMELQNPFGIHDRLLGPDTADSIWEETRAKLAQPAFSTRGLLEHWDVRLVCTTDDPMDDLRHHRAHADDHPACVMIPAFRPDRVMAVEDVPAWNKYIEALGEAANQEVGDFASLISALSARCDYFHNHGCRLADHGLSYVPVHAIGEADASRIIKTLRDGHPVPPAEAAGLAACILTELGRLYHARNWTQQFHVGALRNVNSRLLRSLGRDVGGDMIGDWPQVEGIARLLDRLEQSGSLPRTILYNLNPADNAAFASLLGCFQDGVTPGKIQLGSGWWFLDQKDGIEQQLEVLSNLGLVSHFIGMLTDSRSFLSFSRHEYFRRVLCSVFARDIDHGLLPRDLPFIGKTIRDICYHNAERYFQFPNLPAKETSA